MYQSRKTPPRSQANYRRPADQSRPRWVDGQAVPRAPQSWQDAPAYDEPVYEEAPIEPEWEEPAYPPVRERRPIPEHEEVIATNRMVLLTCTLASMMGLFALFLCYAEKKSRAMRWFAVQSAGLMAAHLAAAAVLAVVGATLGVVPFLGFLIRLICWLIYIAILVATVYLRVRMMQCAWRGVRFTLPMIGRWLTRFC